MSKTIGDFPDYVSTIDATDRLYLFKKASTGGDRDQALYSTALAQFHNLQVASLLLANKIVYTSADNVLASTTFSAFARSFVDDADMPTFQATVGLSIVPVLAADVVAASTAFIGGAAYNNGTAGVGATLTSNSNGAFAAQDGVTLTVGQRFLYKNSSTVTHNGIWTLSQVGDAGTPWILTRATDCDTPAKMGGIIVHIAGGSTLNGARYYCPLPSGQITIGTTLIPFVRAS